MRVCGKCKKTSEEVEFYKHTHGFCKLCKNEATRLRYHQKGTAETDRRRARRKKNAEWVRAYKESNPCCDCGRYFHHAAMDFDHLPQYKKKNGISYLLNWDKKVIEEEITKCELVCSNCHRVRSWDRASAAGKTYEADN